MQLILCINCKHKYPVPCWTESLYSLFCYEYIIIWIYASLWLTVCHVRICVEVVKTWNDNYSGPWTPRLHWTHLHISVLVIRLRQLDFYFELFHHFSDSGGEVGRTEASHRPIKHSLLSDWWKPSKHQQPMRRQQEEPPAALRRPPPRHVWNFTDKKPWIVPWNPWIVPWTSRMACISHVCVCVMSQCTLGQVFKIKAWTGS